MVETSRATTSYPLFFSLVEKQALPESRIQVVLHGWDGLQNDAQT